MDRGAGTFVFLARDTVPDYLDTFALPAARASAVWKYKAIYLLSDTPCGQWSDEARTRALRSRDHRAFCFSGAAGGGRCFGLPRSRTPA